MQVIYNLGIKLYVAMIHVAALSNLKAKQWVAGRKAIYTRIQSQVDSKRKTAWFHVSSLGEFEQGRPVIEAFKLQYPEYQIVLTFFSPSGYEIRKNYEGANAIFYLPADSKKNAHRFLELVNPQIAFFVKYDFWYHYLTQLQKREVPTYIFSAIFRKNQLFFKPYGLWYKKMLSCFTYLFVQNSESKKLLEDIGIQQVEIGGDTRFDRVYQIAQESKDFPEIATFSNQQSVIVAGSTWEKDEELLNIYMKTLGDNIKIIIAPHEIHASNIQRIKNLFGDACLCLSESEKGNLEKAKVLIIDSIGKLSSLYKYGQVAYIGGGFGKGIHNTLEAATYGIPVIFGPNYQKFQEAKDLITQGGAFSIKNQDELNEKISHLFNNPAECSERGNFALHYVNKMRGGTKLLLSKIALK